jgi:hypothetical protein
MATGHNRVSVVAVHSSCLPCKIATVSPREGYPELQDLTYNPLPYSVVLVVGKWRNFSISRVELLTSNSREVSRKFRSVCTYVLDITV